MGLNRTHDPARTSWVDSANAQGCDFPIQNLPFGVFSTGDGAVDGDQRCGVAIGDQIVDLRALEGNGLVRPRPDTTVFDEPELNAFMALGADAWQATRFALFDLLDATNDRLRNNPLCDRALVPMADATLHLPFFVRGYTDFYASREHATNVGTMFRGPENALPPNWLHIPIGYNGRASTVVVSGTDVRRPQGQLLEPGAEAPLFGPSQRLDIELELGAVVGTDTALGDTVTVDQAFDMIFGYVLLNDWSARDIQKWEYQPLGPFQGKAFATSISPWVVTREALEPFRTPAPKRIKPLLPYLHESAPHNFDIHLEVDLAPAGAEPTTVSRSNARYLYYSAAQQLAHHASSGCAMCTGDLLGSGTISGPSKDSYGSLLEMTWGGKNPLELGGTTRAFLEDGDTATLRGHCQAEGYRVGFGSCTGTIVPAHAQD